MRDEVCVCGRCAECIYDLTSAVVAAEDKASKADYARYLERESVEFLTTQLAAARAEIEQLKAYPECGHWREMAKYVADDKQLRAEVDRLVAELGVSRAFYNVTLAQRNSAWDEVERLKEMLNVGPPEKMPADVKLVVRCVELRDLIVELLQTLDEVGSLIRLDGRSGLPDYLARPEGIFDIRKLVARAKKAVE